MKYIAAVTATALIVVLLGLVGKSDLEHAHQEQNEYCEMVRDGHWPDYEKKYNKWCKL